LKISFWISYSWHHRGIKNAPHVEDKQQEQQVLVKQNSKALSDDAEFLPNPPSKST
jgi:hypothetical protein